MFKKTNRLGIDKIRIFYDNRIRQSKSLEEALWGEIGNQKKRFCFMKELLLSLGVSGKQMIDIGCGTGEFVSEYIRPLKLFDKYIGIDLLNLNKTNHADFVFLTGDYRSFTGQCRGSNLLTCIGLLGTPGINVNYELMSVIEFAQQVLLDSGHLIITASSKASNSGESVLSKSDAEIILKDNWSGFFRFLDTGIYSEYVLHLSKSPLRD